MRIDGEFSCFLLPVSCFLLQGPHSPDTLLVHLNEDHSSAHLGDPTANGNYASR